MKFVEKGLAMRELERRDADIATQRGMTDSFVAAFGQPGRRFRRERRRASWIGCCVALGVVALFSASGCSSSTEDGDSGDLGISVDEQALTHDARCNEGDIRSVAPASASAFLDRAFTWVHKKVMYCQCQKSGSGAYRADCSGFVSSTWGLPSPGNTTRQFPGGPSDNGEAISIGWDDLTIGDALNWHDPKGGPEGHVMLFAGWLDTGHTKFCSIEEYETGKPVGILTHSIYESWPTTIKNFHPIRKKGYSPDKPNGGEPPAEHAPPSSSETKYWVDTFETAPGYSTPGTGTATGHLYAGTNYVYCKTWGPKVQVDSDYNHYWLKTDLDDGSPSEGQFVSAYYLSRWGNDEAKDNSGAVIPDCSGAAKPPPPPPPPSPPPDPTSGCASVTYCDAPGSGGTLCKQTGCSLSAAKAECLSDLASLGCQFHCPGSIEVLGGGVSAMCCPGVCSPGCPC